MTPTNRIATALAIWPGREVDVAEKVGVSTRLLRCWEGKPGGRFKAPTEADVERVEQAVKVLLVGRLSRLVDASTKVITKQ